MQMKKTTWVEKNSTWEINKEFKANQWRKSFRYGKSPDSTVVWQSYFYWSKKSLERKSRRERLWEEKIKS